MLKTITKNDKPTAFATLDIETDSNGHPTHYGIYSPDAGFILSKCTDDCIDVLLANNIETYYAHAGMKFDFSILVQRLLAKLPKVSIYYSGSTGIYIHGKTKKKNLFLLDSYQIMPASLSKLSKSFCPELPKLDLQVMPWELPEDKLIEYLQRDCESLYLVIKKFFDNIEKEFGKTSALTLSSLSLKLYRKHFQKYDIWSSNKKLFQFESDSYFGGIVHCKPGKYNVKCYDVNSMYPYIMKTMSFPYKYLGAWCKQYRGRRGLYKINFKYNNGIPFIFDIESRQVEYEGLAIVDNTTLNYLESIGGSYKMIVGYEYHLCDYIFSDFVNYFHRMKQENIEPLRFIYKIILNSLYGKFGQRRERRVVSTQKPKNSRFKSYDVPSSIPGYYREIFDYKEQTQVKHSFPAIASLITLGARLHLRQLADKLENAGGKVVYTDTDSLHVTNQPEVSTSNSLGDLQLEYEGNGAYIGKKIYQLEGKSPKCKGIPGDAIRNQNFFNLVSPKTYEFTQFESILKQLQNKSEFKAKISTRTVNP